MDVDARNKSGHDDTGRWRRSPAPPARVPRCHPGLAPGSRATCPGVGPVDLDSGARPGRQGGLRAAAGNDNGMRGRAAIRVPILPMCRKPACANGLNPTQPAKPDSSGLEPGSKPAPDSDPGEAGRERCLTGWTPARGRGDDRGHGPPVRMSSGTAPFVVMPGLVPGIHVGPPPGSLPARAAMR